MTSPLPVSYPSPIRRPFLCNLGSNHYDPPSDVGHSPCTFPPALPPPLPCLVSWIIPAHPLNPVRSHSSVPQAGRVGKLLCAHPFNGFMVGSSLYCNCLFIVVASLSSIHSRCLISVCILTEQSEIRERLIWHKRGIFRPCRVLGFISEKP